MASRGSSNPQLTKHAVNRTAYEGVNRAAKLLVAGLSDVLRQSIEEALIHGLDDNIEFEVVKRVLKQKTKAVEHNYRMTFLRSVQDIIKGRKSPGPYEKRALVGTEFHAEFKQLFGVYSREYQAAFPATKHNRKQYRYLAKLGFRSYRDYAEHRGATTDFHRRNDNGDKDGAASSLTKLLALDAKRFKRLKNRNRPSSRYLYQTGMFARKLVEQTQVKPTIKLHQSDAVLRLKVFPEANARLQGVNNQALRDKQRFKLDRDTPKATIEVAMKAPVSPDVRFLLNAVVKRRKRKAQFPFYSARLAELALSAAIARSFKDADYQP